MLDKYIGDAIVMMFGMPLPIKNHAARACACVAALCMQKRHAELRRQWAATLEQFTAAQADEPSKAFAPPTPSRVLAQRCPEFIESGRPADWDRAYRMQAKSAVITTSLYASCFQAWKSRARACRRCRFSPKSPQAYPCWSSLLHLPRCSPIPVCFPA
jgi:hypothetical protein